MAMMAKMRSLAPAFIITVGALFVLFMVISDSNVLEALGGRSNVIGSINGREITIDEYRLALDRQIENQKARSGEDLDETQMEQIREQVWESIVTQILFEQKIEEYGLTVSDEEIRDIILGDNPPQMLKQNFIDSLGNFNRQLYQEALFNPANKEALIQAEEMVRQQRLTEKLQSILLASVSVNDEEIRRKFIDQNIEMNVRYGLVDANSMVDSNITISDDDLRDYYEENLENYRVKAQRKLRYVLFSSAPSEEDSTSIFNNLESIKSKFLSDTVSFKEYADIYSETPYSVDTLSPAGITSEVISKLNTANQGDIIGPILTPEGGVLYHLINTINSDQTFANAKHILINQYGSDEKNLEEANKVYDRLKAGESFEVLAKNLSMDPGSAQKGGELGWFGKGVMVPEFENAIFSSTGEELIKPVKTSFGYHIIKVAGRTNKKYVVEKIVIPIKQSETTRDRKFNAANDFSYLAQKNDFKTEAELLNYEVLETPMFQENLESIPGIGANKRLSKFASENSINTISEPFKVQGGYVVVQVADVQPEKIMPFDEVKEQIRPYVLREKKMGIAKGIAEKIYKNANGNLQNINHPDLRVQETGPFKASGTIPGLGRDHVFINKSLEMEVGKLSEPFKGIRGYYMIKVLNRTPFDQTAFDMQRSTLREQLLQEKRTQFLNQWVNKIKENADIEDNRYLYYSM